MLFAWSSSLGQGIVVSGTVRDKHSNSVLSNASVQLSYPGGQIIDTLHTDASGNWSYQFIAVDVEAARYLPSDLSLSPNYPNPFNPSTTISFSVGQPGVVQLTVHDVIGRLIDSRQQYLSPGTYSIRWHGKGSTGVLFYSIETGSKRLTRKMIQLEGGGNVGFGILSSHIAGGKSLIALNRTSVCRAIASDLTHEPDSIDVSLTGSPHADFLLESVHDRAFVIDLHNDVLEKIVGSQYQYDIGVRHSINHTDLPRMRDGGLDAQMLSVYVDPTAYNSSEYYSRAMQFLDSLKSQIVRNSSQIGISTTADSLVLINNSARIAGVFLLEGGHCILNNLDNLRQFYAKGVRCMTITWNNSTSWAVSAKDTRSSTVGLSDFGKEVIRVMDSLGMIIDVSHVGKKTVDDILSLAKGPIIASHSGCTAVCDHYRNLTDDQIKAIARTGGVIGVVFYPPFLSTSYTVTIETVIKHIDHIRSLVGADYIALGSDFDGIERTPVGLEDVSKFPSLTSALLAHGYSRQEVRKILGENFLRVFRAICH